MPTLELSERELNILRDALRMAEERHKRNDFRVLTIEAQDLRSKLSNVIIEQCTNNPLVTG